MRFFSSRCAPYLAVWCAALLSCAPEPDSPPPDVVRLAVATELDPDVREVVEQRIALAEARPTSPERRRDLALALEANGIDSDAVRAWEHALALRPDETLWSYHHAKCVEDTGEPQRALALMREVVAQRPSLSPAQHHLGLLLLGAGRYEEARQAFTVAAARGKPRHYPLAGLADAEFQLGNVERAEELAREALSLDPNYRPARFVLGKALRDQGRRAEAERELTLGMDASPRLMPTPLYPKLGDLERGYAKDMRVAGDLIDQGRPERAVEILSELAEKNDDVNVLVNLGVAYTHMQRPEDAEEVLLRVVEQDPNHYGAYINLAAAQIDLRRLLQAMNYANKAIEVAPDVGRAYMVKAQVYTEMGRHENAYRTLEAAALLDTTDGEIRFKLGHAALRLEEYEEALEHFRKASDLMPGDVGSLVELVKLCLKQKRVEEAYQAYQRAMEVNPKHPLVQDLQARLSRIAEAKGDGR